MNNKIAFGLVVVGVIVALVFLRPHPHTPSVVASRSVSRSATPVVTHSVVRPLSVSSTAHGVVGPPTVTAAFINQVLARAGSPAQGMGQTLSDMGVKYGIDPAFALAFFHHESGYGLHGVARSTLSLGNIRCTAGWRCDPTGGYRAYRSYTEGFEDWYRLLTQVYVANGLNTVEKIIPVYAPNADNNDEANYIASVNADIAAYRRGEVM